MHQNLNHLTTAFICIASLGTVENMNAFFSNPYDGA